MEQFGPWIVVASVIVPLIVAAAVNWHQHRGEAVSQQSIVTYATLDGRDVSLPVSSYLRRSNDGRLDRLWIYIDMAPLFSVAV